MRKNKEGEKYMNNFEKKLYEFLGVNIFRKYFLFTWEKFANIIKFPVGYRLESMTISGIEKYKKEVVGFGKTHFVFMLATLLFFPILSPQALILSTVLHSYCIMTQRYNYIRINEVLKKHQKRNEKEGTSTSPIKEPKIEIKNIESKELQKTNNIATNISKKRAYLEKVREYLQNEYIIQNNNQYGESFSINSTKKM